jgi:hypothetical protein
VKPGSRNKRAVKTIQCSRRNCGENASVSLDVVTDAAHDAHAAAPIPSHDKNIMFVGKG